MRTSESERTAQTQHGVNAFVIARFRNCVYRGLGAVVATATRHNAVMLEPWEDDLTETLSKAASFAEQYRKKAHAVLGAGRAPKQKDVPAHLDQAAAKKMLPPHTSIWLATRGERCGHCVPFTRITAPFTKYGGSEGALRICLQMLWRQHLQLQGKGPEHCPFRNLL